MRILAISAFAISVAVLASSILETATAQTQEKCGPVAYSNSEQKYVGVPCTAPTTKAEEGKAAPCGPVAYSSAEQKYVGVPCTAATPKAEQGKSAPCGPVAYSNAEQKYVGVPCPH